MASIDLAGIAAICRDADSFLLTTHVAADGDALGSMLAVYHLLKGLGKRRVACAIEGPVPRIYQWLPGVKQVRESSEGDTGQEVVIVVDVSRRDRLGAAADLISPDAKVVVIDHHLDDDPFGDFTFIDPSYAAVGEIIVELFDAVKKPLCRDAATCAYVALATDTGGFRFSNTSARSHRIAARLVDAGIDVRNISSRVFDAMSMAKFRLMMRVLEKVHFCYDGHVAVVELTEQDLRDTGAEEEDTDGLINLARNVEGVEVAILFREVDAATTKISFRSKQTFNSADFLRQFGGGGHAAAAGATLPRPLAEAREAILQRVGALVGGKT